MGDGMALTHRRNCKEVNAHVFDHIAKVKYDRIILDAAWRHGHYPMTLDEMVAKLLVTIAKIEKVSPSWRLVLVGPVPMWQSSAFMTWSKLERYGTVATVDFGGRDVTLGPAIAYGDVDDALRKLANSKQITYVSPITALCRSISPNARDGECVLSLDGTPEGLLSADYGHLSLSGSIFVASLFRDALVGAPQRDMAERSRDIRADDLLP